jgi:cobalt-zinc-cadmium efflux system outer membrane protein
MSLRTEYTSYTDPAPISVIRGLLLACGLLLPVLGIAQTLAVAVERAWARQPLASALNAREGEAKARIDVANSLLPAPASMSLSNVNDKFGTDTGKDAWELEVALPMWLPGQRTARKHEAVAGLSEIDARRTALRLQIAGEVREAWWALANARHGVRLAESRETTAMALEADVVRKFKAGELARTDANLAMNESLIARSELLEARVALRQLEQVYRVLTGDDAPPQLVEESMPTNLEISASHPQLSASLALSELAHSRLNVAQENRRDAPELAVKLVRERGDFGTPYSSALGVKLTVPFSSGAKVHQETSAAQADVLQADAELAIARQRIELEVVRNRLDVEATRQQWVNAQKRMEVNADTLRLAEKMFALGESDLPALLKARASAFEAEASFNRQRTAYHASISRLNQSLGVMP